ncbi:leucine-rich repeat transmembrane protein kinase protein, partial [Tanacetum coccineum]
SNETLVIDEDCDESSDVVSEIYEYDLDLGLEDIDESGFFMPDSSDIRFENGVLEEDPYDCVYDGLPSQCHVLKDPRFCVKYGEKKIEFEYPTLCCMGGKTKLVDLDIPPDLYNMFISQCDVGKRFRRIIRAYNTNFSFASMDQLVPRDGKPRYLQLYFYDDDDDEELQHRLSWNNLDEDIVRRLTSVLAENPLYNRLTTSEVAGIWATVKKMKVAGIWVEGNDNISAYERSVVIYGRSEYPETIQPHHGFYDPINEEDEIRSKVNLLLLGGRLLQQFLVDMYIKMETSRLSYLEFNQSHIRADLYQGLVDCVMSGEVQPNRIEQRVVLPASFIGGPRDMRRRFLDVMTLVQDDGKPNLFLTMTCNPKWPEIENELLDGQTASDHPDLVARVFRAKLEVLKNLLFKKNILGRVAAYVYVVEFQKRGLPHVIHLSFDDAEPVINEIKRYQDACYISPPEAMWWIYGFPLANMNPVVVPLQVHLPDHQQVRFADDVDLTRIIERERDKRSMLTVTPLFLHIAAEANLGYYFIVQQS